MGVGRFKIGGAIMVINYNKLDITKEEMNKYLNFLDNKQEDGEEQYLVHDIIFYIFVLAATVVFYRFFDFSLVLTKAIDFIGSRLL